MSFTRRNEKSPLIANSITQNSSHVKNTKEEKIALQKIEENIAAAKKALQDLVNDRAKALVLQGNLDVMNDDIAKHAAFTTGKMNADWLDKYKIKPLLDEIKNSFSFATNSKTTNKSIRGVAEIDEQLADQYRQTIKSLTDTIQDKIGKKQADLSYWENQKADLTPAPTSSFKKNY